MEFLNKTDIKDISLEGIGAPAVFQALKTLAYLDEDTKRDVWLKITFLPEKAIEELKSCLRAKFAAKNAPEWADADEADFEDIENEYALSNSEVDFSSYESTTWSFDKISVKQIFRLASYGIFRPSFTKGEAHLLISAAEEFGLDNRKSEIKKNRLYAIIALLSSIKDSDPLDIFGSDYLDTLDELKDNAECASPENIAELNNLQNETQQSLGYIITELLDIYRETFPPFTQQQANALEEEYTIRTYKRACKEIKKVCDITPIEIKDAKSNSALIRNLSKRETPISPNKTLEANAINGTFPIAVINKMLYYALKSGVKIMPNVVNSEVHLSKCRIKFPDVDAFWDYYSSQEKTDGFDAYNKLLKAYADTFKENPFVINQPTIYNENILTIFGSLKVAIVFVCCLIIGYIIAYIMTCIAIRPH